MKRVLISIIILASLACYYTYAHAIADESLPENELKPLVVDYSTYRQTISDDYLARIERDSIIGLRVRDNRGFRQFSNNKLYDKVKRLKSGTNCDVAIIVLLPDSHSQIYSKNDSNIIDVDMDRSFKIITINDSITKKLTSATKHYYLFPDTIIPVIFEFDLHPLTGIFPSE